MRKMEHRIRNLSLICFLFVGMTQLSLASGKEGISLEAALQMALANPYNLGSTSEAVAEARARLAQAGASRWPSVVLNGKYTRVGPYTSIDPRTGMPYKVGVSDSYATGFSLQWPLYMGGKLNSAVKLARSGLDTAEEDYQAEYENLVYQVFQAYIGFLKADGMLALSQEQIKLLTEHQRLVETNLSLGYAAKTDLLETKIRLTQAELGAVKARHGKKLAEENLCNLLGISTQELVLTSKPTIAPSHILPTMEEALRLAEEGRAELKKLKTAVHIGEENRKMSGGYWKPNLVMIGTYGTQNQKSFTLDEAIWSFTLNLDWKLFDAGAGRAGLKEAEANLSKLNYLLAQSKDLIRLEVRQRYLTVTETAQVLELTKLNRKLAQENYEFLKAKFELGAATNLELLSAHNTLNMALNDYLNAEYDYYLAISALYKAMGEIDQFMLEVSEDA